MSWTSVAETIAWHRVATITAQSGYGAVGEIEGRSIAVVGFAGGYVILGQTGRAVWYSKDATSWRRIKLPVDASRSNDDDANGRLGRAIATDGNRVVVVGGRSVPPCGLNDPASTGGGPDCSTAPIAWVSDDGLRWRVSYPRSGAEFVAVWPTKRQGWIAAASVWSGESLGGRELWRSSDGITWKQMRQDPPAAWEGYDRVPVGLGALPATSLLAASDRGSSRTKLAMRTGSGSWTRVTSFPGKQAEVVTGVGPGEGHASWLLGGRSGAGSNCEGRPLGDPCWGAPTVWLSQDGAAWTTVRLPVGQGLEPKSEDDNPVQVTAVTSLIASSRGYVAVGAVLDPWAGARHDTWVSDDGQAWIRLDQPEAPTFDYGPGLVADGPAGVIGLSGSDRAKQLVVWQLR